MPLIYLVDSATNGSRPVQIANEAGASKSRFIRVLHPGAEEHMSLTLLAQPTSSPSQSLAFDLAERLDEVKEIGFQLQQLGALFSFVPSRVGHNAGLDCALRCLLIAHRNLLSSNKSSQKEEQQNYNQALSLIRDIGVLQNKTSSETAVRRWY